jgi:hypothetical protein
MDLSGLTILVYIWKLFYRLIGYVSYVQHWKTYTYLIS